MRISDWSSDVCSSVLLWVANAVRPWVQYTPPVIGPRGEARLESDVYDEILERLGLPGLFAALGTSETPRPGLMEAADTLLRMGAYGDRFGTKPEGLSIARLREEFPHGEIGRASCRERVCQYV